MSDHRNRLDQLAHRARQETVPPLDVTPQVLCRIRSQPESNPLVFSLLALGSVLAAAVTLVLTLPIFYIMNNPLQILFQFIPTLGDLL